MAAVLAAVAASCSASHPPAANRDTSTSIPATTTTTQPPPQYPPSPYAWDRSTSPALALGGGRTATLAAVLAPQITGSWLVFGSRTGTAGTPAATVWSSADASAWNATALDPGPGPSQALAAARYKSATVAVGSTGHGDGRQATVWLSPAPGGAFTAQSVPASNGPSVMTLVSAGALGMFAAGTVDGRFAMWSSTNGRQWSELPNAEKVITNSPGARVTSLLAEGDYEYAAGSLQSGPVPQAALWSTSDGLNWHLVSSAAPSFAGTAGRVIYSLAPLGSGLVAVGAVDLAEGWVPASWISPDGQSWSLPSVDFPSVPHPARSQAVMGASGGTAARFVSAIPTLAGTGGVVAAGGGPYGQAAWRSADGMHWTSLSMPAAEASAATWRAEGAAGTVDTTVVLDAEPGQPYLLTDHLAPSTGAEIAPTSTPASIPGTWSQPSSNPDVFGPVRPEAVPVALASSGGRLQLTVDVLSRPQSVGPAAVATMVLSSADGSAWAVSPAGTVRPGDPPAPPAPGALALHLPAGWVAAVSPAGTAPQIWTSSDGVTWGRAASLSVPAPGTAATPTTTTTTTASGAPAATGAGASVVNGICALRLPPAAAPPTTGSVSATTVAPARYAVAAVGAAAASSIPAAGSAVPGEASIGASVVTTRSPAAWYSSPGGGSWRFAPVAGTTPAGGASSMSGCLSAGSGLAAFGTATATGGAPVPGLWRSPDGSAWTRVGVSAFNAGPPSPLVSVAVSGDSWLAAANPDPGSDPFRPGTAGGPGPAASAGQDAGVGPAPSLEDGRDGLWASANGGSGWQLINTSTAPWLGAQRSEIDLVAFSAGSAVHATSSAAASSSTSPSSAAVSTSTTSAPAVPQPVPVVVGVVDGQLAVWTGTPAPASSPGAGS